MMILSRKLDMAAFWNHLRKESNRILLLDYDGTLAPFRVERDMAVPYPGVRRILEKIIATGRCRVVIISGRSIENLLPLLAVQPVPEIWGSHGRERLYANGSYRLEPTGSKADAALKEALNWANSMGLQSHCESKPGCLAFHVRGLAPEEADKLLKQVRKAWSPIEQGSGLRLHCFDGGLELRVEGRHKGHAVETVFEESGPETVAAYLGDDITDEDAFRAIKGRGIGVLVRTELRPTDADLWIRPPEELLEFLSQWTGVCRPAD